MNATFKGDFFTWALNDQGQLTIKGAAVSFFYLEGHFTPKSINNVPIVVNEKGIAVGHTIIDPESTKSFALQRKLMIQYCVVGYQAGNEMTEVWISPYSEKKSAEKTKDLVKIFPEIVAVAKEMRQRDAVGQQQRKAEEPARQQQTVVDPALLEKLKKLVKVSEKLKVAQMAQILNLTEKELYDRIIDWAAEFGFTLDEDVVKFGVGRKDDFIASLEKDFADWGKKAENKDGKV